MPRTVWHSKRQEQPKIIQEERKMNNENTATATAVAIEAVKEVSELTPVGSFKENRNAAGGAGHSRDSGSTTPKGYRSQKVWQNLATTELEQIEKWNEENFQYNAGVVAKLNGFWMLDCDVARPAADDRKRNR